MVREEVMLGMHTRMGPKIHSYESNKLNIKLQYQEKEMNKMTINIET